MNFSVQNYIENINRLNVTRNAREHSYRGDLQRLLAFILPQDILVTNEPARVECWTPDYKLTKELTWNLYIGGFQLAQGWLKNRNDLELDFDDVLHYKKMIVALTETDRLMKEIDKVLDI